MFDNLPHYIDHEIDYGDVVETHRFFLSLNRDINGKWSCGYIHYATEEDAEMAIPELTLNGAETLQEADMRMQQKLERYRKLHAEV